MNSTQPVPVGRLLSLDALRAFDMFWITGGGLLVAVLADYSGAGWLSAVANQMHHAEWVGFNFLDLVFPLFMFISGVAIPFSLVTKLEKNVSKGQIIKKTMTRALTLVILGMIYNGVIRNGFENPRFASVLGQIGLAYLFASLIVIYTRSFKKRLYWLIGILVGYGIVQLLVPVPGVGAGVLTPEGCINGYIDRAMLPGKLNDEVFDPEGLMCIVSAVAITLMGTFAGTILRDKETGNYQKIKTMLIAGASLIIAALIISTFYPIIKRCWTSTYNLLTGGISFILMATFYWIIDVKGWKKWSFFFRVIGMNSIFIYLLYDMVDVGRVSSYILGWTVLLGPFGEIINVVGSIMLVWSLLYFMYKKTIFLKV